MRPSISPLTRMALGTTLFGLGPKAASSGNIDVFVRGVVQAMQMEIDAAQVAYRPHSIVEDLILSSDGGYVADWKRTVLDAALLVDAAIWRFDFARGISQDIVIADDGTLIMDFNRSLEQQLVLQSLAVNKHSFMCVLANILNLAQAVHQNLLVESLLDILLLEQDGTLQRQFLRNVEDQLNITAQGSTAVHFMRALTDVVTFNQNAALNGDFIRSVADLLLIVDDPQYLKWILVALNDVLAMDQNVIDQLIPGSTDKIGVGSDTLALIEDLTFRSDYNRALATQMALQEILSSNFTFSKSATIAAALTQAASSKWAFPRSDTRTMNLTQNGAYSLTAVCSKIDRNTINTTVWNWVQACIGNNSARTPNVTESRTNFGGTALSTTAGKYRGAVLGPNGYVYCVPSADDYVLKLDVSGNTQTQVSTNLNSYGSAKWSAGALAKSSNFFICSPWSATAILTFNTANDTSVVVGSGITGTTKWSGIITTAAGYSYCIPYTATYMLGIDNANTSNTFNALTGCTGSTKWAGAGPYPDGYNFIMVPFTSTVAVKVNTGNTATSPSTSNIVSSLTGGNKWIMGVLADNNTIYCIPFDSVNCLKIYTGNDGNATFGNLSGTDKYGGGIFAWSQKVYMAPYNNAITSVGVIDTLNESLANTSIGVTSDAGKYTGGILYPDGKVIMVPSKMQRASWLNMDVANTAPTLNVILAPWFNRSY